MKKWKVEMVKADLTDQEIGDRFNRAMEMIMPQEKIIKLLLKWQKENKRPKRKLK